MLSRSLCGLIDICLVPYGLQHLGVPIPQENYAITSQLTIMCQKTLPLHYTIIPKSSHQLDANFEAYLIKNDALGSVPFIKGTVVLLLLPL